MAQPIQILIVEDNSDDAELLLQELRRADFDPKWKRVETEPDYCANLGTHLDVIFSDFSLPRFSTSHALALLQKNKLDVPLIIVSGTIGEERAVESIKAGATDYVPKNRIDRIGPVVKRALRETKERTERKQREVQFIEAQKMAAIGQLAGGVAHDFNNILAVIQMRAGLLETSGNLSAEQVDFTTDISAAAQRAAALTRQLLLFSHREVFQPRDLDLGKAITNLMKMLRRTIGEDIQTQFRFALQPLFIHADAGMVDQVLMNLALNSRDAMPKGGRLTIETTASEFDQTAVLQFPEARPGSFARLSVSDTGCGIPAENLPRIFEPFFTTKEIGQGTGLGLATVYGIVQQHHGWINVVSEPDQGTTFHVYFPAVAGQGVENKDMDAASSCMPRGSETILVVEDILPVRMVVSRLLQNCGYNILQAGSGVDALKVWQKDGERIDLLLTDIIMPGGMTGFELAEQLQAAKPRLRILYTSGYSNDFPDKRSTLVEGLNFLQKPYSHQQLAETLRKNLDLK